MLLKHVAFLAHGKQVAFLWEARALWSSRTHAARSTPSSSETSQQAQVENWYPGHMQKAVRDMQGRLKQVDLILEVRDARVPMSSCSTVMESLLRGKRRIVVLNKADLVPKEDLKLALSTQAKRSPQRTMAVSANDPESIKRLMRASLEVIKTERPTADESLLMVVGLPNAGKSSIVNDLKACAARARLLDGQSAYHKKAKTGPLPGVTRAPGSFQLSKQPRVFVLDTPGVLPPAIQDPQAALNIALTGGMPATVTDSAILVRYLLGLLLQHPKKYTQLLRDHLVTGTHVEEAHHEEDRAGRSGKGGHDPHQQQDQNHRHQQQQQQQDRGTRTHRRAQRVEVGHTQRHPEDSGLELPHAQHQRPTFTEDQRYQQQHQHKHHPAQISQPMPPLHKACSSVVRALIEALAHSQHVQHMSQPGRLAGTWDGQYLSSPQGTHVAGPVADLSHDIVDLDSPAGAVDSSLHHLIVLLSRDSRRGPRGWGKVSRQVSEVPVSAAQRQGACDCVLWAFRKGQLGRLMLDDIILQDGK